MDNIIKLPSGFPHWILFWELYNNSKQQGFGLADVSGQRPMTLAEAYLEYHMMEHKHPNNEVRLDYHNGRVMKVDLGTDEVRFDLYDRDNGEGKFEEIFSNVSLTLGCLPWADQWPEEYVLLNVKDESSKTDELLSAIFSDYKLLDMDKYDEDHDTWFGYPSLHHAKEHLDHLLRTWKVDFDDPDEHNIDTPLAGLESGSGSEPLIIYTLTSICDGNAGEEDSEEYLNSGFNTLMRLGRDADYMDAHLPDGMEYRVYMDKKYPVGSVPTEAELVKANPLTITSHKTNPLK